MKFRNNEKHMESLSALSLSPATSNPKLGLVVKYACLRLLAKVEFVTAKSLKNR